VVLRRALHALPLSLLVSALSGCGGDQNTLNARSGAESAIVRLWWAMLAGSAVGFGVVLALLIGGWLRRNRRVSPAGEQRATALVVVLGVVIPIAALTALFVWSDVVVIRSTAAPPAASAQLTVRVIAHQWWWEVRYPGTRAVTANEIHVPVHTRVDVVGTSADVIHSFWVPQLNRKIDLIPGRTGTVLIDADEPGTYEGQCAEFCGVQHAHMTVAVIAQSPAQFKAWLARMAAPARAGAGQKGLRVFLDERCANCHTIRGTPAGGEVGPDLTHLASRATLAALTIPNRPDYLRGWIADPQHFKPGALMPAVPLTNKQLDELTSYLSSLH
jgi:cytochrome c oxidase subunit II